MTEHRLRIPDRDLLPLTWLARTSDAEFGALRAAMESDAQSAGALIEASVKPLDGSGLSATAFVDMLINMNAFRLAHGQAVDDFLPMVTQSPGLDLEPSERTLLMLRLVSLLSADSVLLVSKAADLLVDQPRVFHSCRIITELRPVFDEDGLLAPTAFVVFHSLKIDFTEDDDYGSIFISLDDSDIARLGAAVERARKKSDALTQWITNTGLRVANAEPGPSSSSSSSD